MKRGSITNARRVAEDFRRSLFHLKSPVWYIFYTTRQTRTRIKRNLSVRKIEENTNSSRTVICFSKDHLNRVAITQNSLFLFKVKGTKILTFDSKLHSDKRACDWTAVYCACDISGEARQELRDTNHIQMSVTARSNDQNENE